MRDTILIIDDVEMDRAVLGQMFQENFKIAEEENGKAGIEYLEKHLNEIAMLLLDIKMPVMNGYEVMEYMKERNLMSQIPVILITGEEIDDAMERGYAMGASDVIFKPFSRRIVVQRVKNVVELYRHKSNLEEMVQSQTNQINEQYDNLKEHHEHLVEILHDIIAYRNTESMQHIKYVQGYTKILANQYAKLYPRSRMTKKKIDIIVQAAEMHDVGKIAMPDFVINRPGRLSKAELELLKEHTIKGSKIMKVMFSFQGADYSRICHNVCLYHHEKYDGTGYPYGIEQDKIPIEAQLVALADMYDVLVNKSVNRQPVSKERAYYMLMNGECGELSPRMKECLQEAKSELEELRLESK